MCVVVLSETSWLQPLDTPCCEVKQWPAVTNGNELLIDSERLARGVSLVPSCRVADFNERCWVTTILWWSNVIWFMFWIKSESNRVVVGISSRHCYRAFPPTYHERRHCTDLTLLTGFLSYCIYVEIKCSVPWEITFMTVYTLSEWRKWIWKTFYTQLSSEFRW